MAKIYFSAAIAQKDTYADFYARIVGKLEKDGNTVFQDTTLVKFEEAVNKSDAQRVKYYQQVLNWINLADLVVLEVSFPSTLHIGHEVSLALEKGKPVVALYHQGKEPAFFLGLQEDKVFWGEYDKANLEKVLEEGINYARSQLAARFNFIITNKQVSHLDKMAKKYKMPRAAYLRQLIDEDVQK